MPVDVLDDSDVAARPVDNAPEIVCDVAVHRVDISPKINSDATDIAPEIDYDVAVDIAPEIDSHAPVRAVLIAREINDNK